jgi:hypothetical protein
VGGAHRLDGSCGVIQPPRRPATLGSGGGGRPVRRSPLAVQRAVLFALIVRELRTRFGRYRLGYLWVVLEPTPPMWW